MARTRHRFYVLAVGVWAALSVRAALVVNEVCYENSTVADETGDKTSDWIELYNTGPGAVNVNGYGLGDANPYDEAKGVRLPDYTIPPGGYLVVFANSALPEYTAWVKAPDLELIPANGVWRYAAPAAEPVATWKTNTFNDASWARGMAPLGYNDAKANLDCATVLGYGGNPASRYPAAYFRYAFEVLNPPSVTGLVARARFNDGMVVYLNGCEVWRQNMPAGAVGYSTLASAPRATTLWTTALLATNGLVQGTNVLAVEVHQAAVSSVDLVLDLTLTGLVNAQVPVVHGQFGLSKEGENVHLFNAASNRLHKFEPATGAITPGKDQTYGAYPDGSLTALKVFDRPTPGAANSAAPSAVLTAGAPAFSVAPGVYAANQSVALTTAAAGTRVHYSLDGSDPRLSPLYVSSGGSVTVSNVPAATGGLAWIRTNPVEIGGNVPEAAWLPPSGAVGRAMTLRAVAISTDGKYCSPETRGTYFVGAAFAGHTLPLVSVIAETNDLFGFTGGLFVPGKAYADSEAGYGENKWGKPYANYHQDSVSLAWERPAHVELFEPGQAQAAFAQVLGVMMHGGGTRTIPQKSLYMVARSGEYGTYSVEHPLFPGEAAVSYKRFLLRNSGNDWYGPDYGGVGTMMKDAVIHEIVKRMDLSVMAYRPAVAYVNGEYWGLHNLRESYDKHYLATRYGLDPENVDILMHEEDSVDKTKVRIVRLEGDTNADEEYEALIGWVQANPLSSTANYQQFQTWVDVTNYMDYIIAETFFANTDWPINNCDFWRAHTNQTATCGRYGDTRWRWMLYDLDMAGAEGAAFNMFTYLTSDKMTGSKEPGFLINALWQNAAFRTAFVTRYANALNTTFLPYRTSAIVGQAAERIAPEIETHFRRWGRAYTQAQWQQAVNTVLTQFSATRHAVSWSHVNGAFGLGGTGALTVRNDCADGRGGRFRVNGVMIDTATDGVTNRAAWTGTFFRNLAVPVEAVPDPGYVFVGWRGTSETNAAVSRSVTASPVTLTGLFREASPAGYVRWQAENYTSAQILDGVSAEPGSASGFAGMSNFELYAFGMSRTDGLSDAQRRARAELSIHGRDAGLWLGYTRLNDGAADIRYTLKVADALGAAWRDAVVGPDLDGRSLTNVLDAATWYFEIRLPAPGAGAGSRFFKLEAAPQ